MKLDNKKLLDLYVKYGVKFVNLNVNLLNGYMKHLIVIQGLDPNTEPGVHFRKLLNHAMDTGIDNKDYDKDYDFSWAYKKYSDVRDKLGSGKLDLNVFNKMTDISKLDDSPAKEDTNPQFTDAETETINYFDDIFTKTSIKESLNLQKIKSALEILEKYTNKKLTKELEKHIVKATDIKKISSFKREN